MKKSIVFLFVLVVSMLVSFAGPPPISVRDCVIDTAEYYLDVRETSTNLSVEIDQFLASTGLGSGYAWCAAFVNYVYDVNGVETPGKYAAWSPSWFPEDKVVYTRTNARNDHLNSAKTQIQHGDVFGIYYPNKNRVAHVGLIKKWPNDNSYCYTIEGNTNNNGSREGNGVYSKRRLKRQIYQVSNWIDTKQISMSNEQLIIDKNPQVGKTSINRGWKKPLVFPCCKREANGRIKIDHYKPPLLC